MGVLEGFLGYKKNEQCIYNSLMIQCFSQELERRTGIGHISKLKVNLDKSTLSSINIS